MTRRARVVLVLAGALAAALAVPAQGAASLRLGFMDQAVMGLAPADTDAALQRARAAGAGVWRVGVAWARLAPDAPPDAATAADPDWPGYRFATLDRHVRAITAAGLEPLVYVTNAPAWAEGPGRPADAPSGTWRPRPDALRAFAVALGRRYAGTHPDPLTPGATLPRVVTWQTWNEPNLADEITPQWERRGGRTRPASPSIYRALHTALRDGLKTADPRARVITAGTAPYGDPGAGRRIPPVRFWRELLCVSGRERLRARSCPRLALDGIAHHPYPIGPPRRHARNADDATVPDLGRITRVVDAARRRGTITGVRGRPPLWVTEISWESAPDPDGLSLGEHATYLQAALYVLARQGARVVVWFGLRDQAPRPSFAASFQSGVLLRGASPAADTAKPAFTAFSFPFTAYRTAGVARLWGLAPAAGPVEIQARSGGRWVTAARLRAGADRLFGGRLRVGPGTELRAVSSGRESLVWRVV